MCTCLRFPHERIVAVGSASAESRVTGGGERVAARRLRLEARGRAASSGHGGRGRRYPELRLPLRRQCPDATVRVGRSRGASRWTVTAGAVEGQGDLDEVRGGTWGWRARGGNEEESKRGRYGKRAREDKQPRGGDAAEESAGVRRYAPKPMTAKYACCETRCARCG